MMRNVVILGVGMTDFGRFPERPVAKVGAEAVLAALKDAGMKWKEIPAVYCAHAMGRTVDGQLVEAELGHTGITIVNVSNACAGGGTAALIASQAVALGLYDLVLAMGVDQAPRGPLGGLFPPTVEGALGIDTWLAKYAMKIQRAIHERRYTLDQIAMASVKNHNNACLNPRSQYKIHMSGVEDVHRSRMIADPMTLYHCCPTGDGAAAAIFCTEEIARRHTTPPFIKFAGGALTSQTFIRGELADTREVTVRAAKKAYEICGVGPKDLDVIELHDNFAVSELEHIVDLGLCREEEVGHLMEEGVFNITGRIPVNVSGGLLGKGHPTAATGIAQICELVWQLRGQAGQRQVNHPKAGLAHCCGGDEGMATYAHIVNT
jgi:benzoylsuccinyl-CoA thiolase BbsB subunit